MDLRIRERQGVPILAVRAYSDFATVGDEYFRQHADSVVVSKAALSRWTVSTMPLMSAPGVKTA